MWNEWVSLSINQSHLMRTSLWQNVHLSLPFLLAKGELFGHSGIDLPKHFGLFQNSFWGLNTCFSYVEKKSRSSFKIEMEKQVYIRIQKMNLFQGHFPLDLASCKKFLYSSYLWYTLIWKWGWVQYGADSSWQMKPGVVMFWKHG